MELYQQKKEEGNFISTERHHRIRPLPKSFGSHFEGIEEKAPLRFETGTKSHDHPRKIVGPSRQNYLNNMVDGAIYEGKLDLCLTLIKAFV